MYIITQIKKGILSLLFKRILMICLFITKCYGQTDTTKVDLHGIATVQFPGTPEYKIQPPNELYSQEDSLGYRYLAVRDYVNEPWFFILKGESAGGNTSSVKNYMLPACLKKDHS